WDHRPLDAVIVKSVIQQKNRILGRYEDRCFMFGVVFDPEFAMQRDPVVADCKDERSLNRWESFQTQWNIRYRVKARRKREQIAQDRPWIILLPHGYGVFSIIPSGRKTLSRLTIQKLPRAPFTSQ